MASKIVLKKSSVAAKVPVAGDLDFGELAINYTDGKLYFKKADNTIDAFTTAAASAPVTSVGGNIGDITDAQLLASIKNVDGTGSGLDADTLDGNHASAFYLASNPNGYTSNTGTVTSVGATAPLVSSGGTAPSISIPAANSTTNGYMSSAYASKLDGIAAGATNVTNTNQLVNGAGYITSSGSITGSAGSVSGLTLTNSSNSINPDNVTQNQLGYNTSVSLFGQTDGGLYSSAHSSSWIHQIYGDFRTGQIAIRGKNSGTWQGWRTVLDSSNYTSYTMARDAWNGNLYFNNDGRIYCTIMYDSNNSGYYSDPNGTSRLSTVNADTLRSYNNIYLDNNYGSSIIGVYSSYRYQGVFSMGDAYKLALDGTTTGNLYGLAWSHPNAGGTAGNLNTHGLLVLENGGFLAAVSGSIRSRDDMRSPIFYDSNNTSRYVDPSSNSYMGDIYNYGWFRNWGQQGLYNQDYGGHFYMQSSGVWSMTGNGGNFELQCRANHNSTIRGYLYGDTSNNFGLLNQNGSWKVRVNGSETEIYDYMYFNDGRGYIFYDRNNTGYYCDPNGTSNFATLSVSSLTVGGNGVLTSGVIINHGSIGSIGVFQSNTATGYLADRAAGSLYVSPSDQRGYAYGSRTQPSGTWRCLGYTPVSNLNSDGGTCVWCRIA